MPEGVGYGPQYTASVGNTLNYIGDHVYGISGGIGATNANIALMSFTTAGNSYIVAEIQIGSEAGVSEDFRYEVLFNGVTIMDNYADTTFQASPNFGFPLKVIIPPQTKVEIKADNLGSANARTTYAIITGRVYGKIE